MRTLDGKTVLITGGASGIGRALCHRFARSGARVVIADRDASRADGVASEIARESRLASAYAMDVTSPESVDAIKSRVLSEIGPVDVLVNNAGIVHGGAFLEVPVSSHVATYRVNVEGVAIVTHAWLPHLIERPEAHVVNMASASSFVGLPFGSTYGSSKWAVLGLTESLRLELRELGHTHVGTTAICPSYVGTGMFDGARAPKLTRLLTPERVADLAVRAVLAGKTEVLVPWLVRVTPLLRAILPRPAFDIVAAAFGVNAGMKSWRGRLPS